MNDTLIYDEAAGSRATALAPNRGDLKGIAGDPSDNIKGVPGVARAAR